MFLRDSYLEEGGQIVAVNLTQHVRLGEAHVCKQHQAHPEGALLDDQFNARNPGRFPVAVCELAGAPGRALVAVDLADALDFVVQDKSPDLHIVEERVYSPFGDPHTGAPGDAPNSSSRGFDPLASLSRDEVR